MAELTRDVLARPRDWYFEIRRRVRQDPAGALKCKVQCNARMAPKQIKSPCQLNEAGAGMMQKAMTELNLSARAYDRILKVSRTIADLTGSENVEAEHVADVI
jgi:magnesium chelatase family protein